MNITSITLSEGAQNKKKNPYYIIPLIYNVMIVNHYIVTESKFLVAWR